MKYIIKKYLGDDNYSYAVLLKDTNRPVVTGCSKREANYHKLNLEKGECNEKGKKI